MYLENVGIRSIERLEGVPNPLIIRRIRNSASIISELDRLFLTAICNLLFFNGLQMILLNLKLCSLTGCSHGCKYCYLKGMGMNHPPKPKKMLYDESGQLSGQLITPLKFARDCYRPELKQLIAENPTVKEKGIFLSFATDPLLLQTIEYTNAIIKMNARYDVKSVLLTKTSNKSWLIWLRDYFMTLPNYDYEDFKNLIEYGVTLTGFDELEPDAAPNRERKKSLQFAKTRKFTTWVSLEPIIDFNKSLEMIEQSKDFTDYYKIGLHSRKKYARTEALEFKRKVEELLPTGNFEFKNSFKKLIDEV